jgi:hypothetical protein
MATSPIYSWPEPDDTSLVKNGALAMRTLGNAIDTTMATMVPKSIVDAKGDLIGATANDTPARLAVGTNGQVLTADSTAATGLAWATPSGGSNTFFAGKNKIINGDFGINQRAFTSTTAGAYTFDRWRHGSAGGTVTTTAQTFTAGTAPVAGYEGKNFIQQATTGQSAAGDYSFIGQVIEGVRTFAGQTVTVSFWAKASSGTPKVGITLRQLFGTGGSTTVSTANAGQAITTSWARYSSTITLPSISGKTIAGGDDGLDLLINTSTGSTLAALGWSNIGIQNSTITVWGVQIEAGSTATDFVTASGGSPQAELAMCQRYYYRNSDSSTNYASFIPAAITANTTQSDAYLSLPVTMRTKPSSVDFANLQTYDYVAGAGYAISNVTINSNSSPSIAVASLTFAAATAGRFIIVRGNNSASAYLGFSAEL